MDVVKLDSMNRRNISIARLVGAQDKREAELSALRQFYWSWRDFHEECADPEATQESKLRASEFMIERASELRGMVNGRY